MRRLHADALAREDLGQGGDDRARRLAERHALDLRRGLGVAEVGVDGRVGRRLDEDRGVRALEAREVPDIDQPSDEQWLLQPCREPLDPGHPSLRFASSSSACR